MGDIAALWVSMSVCIPTYMLASSLIAAGHELVAGHGDRFLGNTIVLLPMMLNGHAGTRMASRSRSLRAPPLARWGQHVALLRALVACGWFGIQTWIGGLGHLQARDHLCMAGPGIPCRPIAGINVAQLGCFLFFWAINVVIFSRH
jgi:NCS1 family nucleobase:cation symporter-1